MYKDSVAESLDKGLNFVDEVPNFLSIKTTLYNARNKAAGTPKTVFQFLEEVKIPQIFDDFLLAEYSCDETRIFIFSSQESKKLITTIKEAFVDSTFKSCPKPFAQLLSIHGDLGSTQETTSVRPLIFALMSNKKESSYIALLEIIKSQIGWNIIKIHCDFEIAFINAISTVFPDISIVGCYYHWMRNVWKKAKILKHNKKTENRIIGMCAVLPLLPSDAVGEGWAYIKSKHEDANLKMTKFMKYMQRFMNKKNFIPIITVFGERHRTNNVVESWHSYLNKRLNKNTVTILRLLNILKKLDKYNILTKQIHSRTRKDEYIIQDDYIRHVQLQYIHGVITLGHALDKLR